MGCCNLSEECCSFCVVFKNTEWDAAASMGALEGTLCAITDSAQAFTTSVWAAIASMWDVAASA